MCNKLKYENRICGVEPNSGSHVHIQSAASSKLVWVNACITYAHASICIHAITKGLPNFWHIWCGCSCIAHKTIYTSAFQKHINTSASVITTMRFSFSFEIFESSFVYRLHFVEWQLDECFRFFTYVGTEHG